MTVQQPEMILFDYGQTLIHEYNLDPVLALDALRSHIYPHDFNAKEVTQFAWELQQDQRKYAFNNNVEMLFNYTWRYIFNILGLKCDLPDEEFAFRFWQEACPAEAMPGIIELLAELEERHIRTAVISNISFSSAVLQKRIEYFIPEHNFEFFVASSETCFRKPLKWIFLSALEQNRLAAEKCWYVGDDIYCDVQGALDIGMHPVWYSSDHDCFYERSNAELTEDLRGQVDVINHFNELIDLLD